MANTIAELLPDSAKFDGAGNFPQRMEQGTAPKRVVLAFDAATDEAAYWKFIARQGLTGTMKIIIQYWMASATTGTIAFEVSIEKTTPDAAFDMEGAASFDTANAGNETVPGTQGYLGKIEITLTNKDSIAAGDSFRVKVEFDTATATAAGDCYMYAGELQDSV